MTREELAAKLIDAGRILVGEGHADMTRGHVSVRLPDDPTRFLMKPHSFGMEEITPENLVICNLEGEKVGGGGPRHSEVYIHSEIYRARPDVNSVLHSHPDNAVAFSSAGLEMRPYSQPAAAFFEALPVYTGMIDLIRSQEQGAGVAKALGPHRAVLLRSHGIAIAGATIEDMVILAVALESACRIALLVAATGKAGPEFSREDVLSLQKNTTSFQQHAINFEYLRRKHAGK